MLSIEEAALILKKAMPNGQLKARTTYKDFYIFVMFTDEPEEEQWDPYYSVNKNTGEIMDFSLFQADEPILDRMEEVT